MRDIPSPNQFMRTLRPERFSDSVVVEKPLLDRPQLEYHISTLTSRSQETTFEAFARGLVGSAICPNLLPHTGPTGGGDSKVDTETYPVADSLSLGWHTGIGREAAHEKWAFAFSAAANWKPKLKSDIEKIAKTKRGYVKAFFVTSQYVKDKDRAELEDELRKIHSIEIHILDRAWILDTVFKDHHENFAIETLGLSQSLLREVKRGPRDIKREDRFDELEITIKQSLKSGSSNFTLVKDCIESAKLARGLERPKTDVDGRFLRARRLAEKLDSTRWLFECLYQWAWTSFFWYEDYTQFVELAKEAFEIGKDFDNAYQLELLCNLFSCLRAAVDQQYVDADTANLESIKKSLLNSLDNTGKIEERPSNALYAQTLAAQVRLLNDSDHPESQLRILSKIVEDAQPMLGYPFEAVAELVSIMGSRFSAEQAYNDLFEKLIIITSNRKGDVTAAQMLLKRAAQQLSQGNHLDAITITGRGLSRLYKHESRDDLVQALRIAGFAYSEAGLLWAARGSLINAASIATLEFHIYGYVTPEQVACYQRLAWLELQLGRLPQALEWYQLCELTSRALKREDEGITENARQFATAIGVAFLNLDINLLSLTTQFPDALDKLGLFFTRTALLYALGHPAELPDGLLEEGSQSDAEFHFFKLWRDQPIKEQIQPLSLGFEKLLLFESNILGCHIVVDCENKAPACDLSESFLAALESLLSTALGTRLIAREPILKVQVRVSEYGNPPFSFRIEHVTGRPNVYIAVRPFNPHNISHEEQHAVKSELQKLLIEVFSFIVLPPDDEGLKKLFGEDQGLTRAVQFTSSFVTVGNVLGYSPKTTIDQWINPEYKRYSLVRDKKWDSHDPPNKVAVSDKKSQSGDEVSSEQPTFTNPTRHSDVQTVSLIRESLWNNAKWIGVGYFSFGMDTIPPRMALMFMNSNPAFQIIEGLLEDLGDDDKDDKLRISVIRGISKANPTWYRVAVAPNLDAERHSGRSKGVLFMIARTHTMEATTTENLDRFLSSVKISGSYHLAVAVANERKEMVEMSKLMIHKHTIHVKDAWEIGPNDPDMMGIRDEDDPILPEKMEKIPFLELAERKKAKLPKS